MMKQNTGLLITFEGIDGCGKSTQLAECAQALLQYGISPDRIVKTRNPGGTLFGQALRDILLHSDYQLTSLSELLLFITDRAHHMETLVLPALQAGRIVLCDRYIDSTLAYQGYGRQLDVTLITQLNAIAIQGKKPDLTFLLDGDPVLLRGRITTRGQADRMEQEKIEFYQAVRHGFLTLARQEPERILVLDALQTVPELQEQVMNAVLKQLSQGSESLMERRESIG
jgi:dTMP kinase